MPREYTLVDMSMAHATVRLFSVLNLRLIIAVLLMVIPALLLIGLMYL